MKFLFDFFPVLFFFIAYKMHDIYVATAVLIIACFIQTIGFWLKHRHFEKSHVITLVLVAAFGGATLFLQDEMFIKWKPSVINWLFGMVFIGSQFVGKMCIIQRMLGSKLELPDPIWIKLNMMWAGFFIVLGFINLYVIYNYDTDTWVNFKLFGLTGLMFIFMVIQGIYLARHIKEEHTE